MSMTPEQMRKKSIDQADSLRQARYAQANGAMRKENTEPPMSPAIEAAGRRVNAATAKETASIGMQDPSPNNDVRFDKGF